MEAPVRASGEALLTTLLLAPAVTLILRRGLHVVVCTNRPADCRFSGLAVISIRKLPRFDWNFCACCTCALIRGAVGSRHAAASDACGRT